MPCIDPNKSLRRMWSRFWDQSYCAPYVYTLATTVFASNNIYEQHYQMHRFAVDYYKAPIAVNDLGLVSYQNDAYVLDFGGLASREALSHQNSSTGEWMGTMAHKYNVKLAMIYDAWFIAKPANWTVVGKLYLGRQAITPASNVVTFYAMDSATAHDVQPLLRNFQKTLPADVQFVAGPVAGR